MPVRSERSAACVRPASVADAHAIAQITVAAWQAAYRSILPADFLDSMRLEPREVAWTDVLTRDDGATRAWVAQHGERVVGFVSCGPVRDDDLPAPAREIYALYVEPDQWRRGYGSVLLDTATRHLGTAMGGPGVITLWVLAANQRARRFYEALGWTEDGAACDSGIAGPGSLEVRYRRPVD